MHFVTFGLRAILLYALILTNLTKGWQLTHVQHTRRLTRVLLTMVQHTNYGLHAVYENESCAAHSLTNMQHIACHI